MQVEVTGGPHAGWVGEVVENSEGVPESFITVQAPDGLAHTVHKSLTRAIEPAPEPVHTTPPDLDGDTIEVYADGSWICRASYGIVNDDGNQASAELGVYGLDIRHGGATLLTYATTAEARAVFAGLMGKSVQPDLKPRGAKRQWWLMPLDTLAYVIEVTDGQPLSLLEELGTYQSEPNAEHAARCVGALLQALRDERDLSFEQALDLVVQVFEYGAEKYNPDNWRNAIGTTPVELFGVAYSPRDAFRLEYLSGQCRHLFATNGPIDLDHTLPDGTEVKGSGLPHLAHAVCGALMVTWHELHTFR